MCEVFWDDTGDKTIEIDEVVSEQASLNDKAANIESNSSLLLGCMV